MNARTYEETQATILARSLELVAAERAAIDLVEKAVQTPEYFSMVNWMHSSLSDGKRLVITGVGKNANIATKISETMASLGISCFYLNTSHAAHGDYGFLQPSDIVIHISRSGTTQEMLDAIMYIHEAKLVHSQVLIHCNPAVPKNSALAFEICIGKVIEGDKHKLAPTASTTALLCLLDAIAATLSDLRGFERYDFLRLHPAGALGKQLKEEKAKQ